MAAPKPDQDAEVREDIPTDWWADFEAARRRPLATRIRYSFIHTYKPVLDDARFRAFDSMDEYRRWCEKNLAEWLGYGRVWLPPGRGGPGPRLMCQRDAERVLRSDVALVVGLLVDWRATWEPGVPPRSAAQ